MKDRKRQLARLRKKIFEDKEKFHLEQAKLPIEEKIKILIKLQELAAQIKKATGRPSMGIWGEQDK